MKLLKSLPFFFLSLFHPIISMEEKQQNSIHIYCKLNEQYTRYQKLSLFDLTLSDQEDQKFLETCNDALKNLASYNKELIAQFNEKSKWGTYFGVLAREYMIHNEQEYLKLSLSILHWHSFQLKFGTHESEEKLDKSSIEKVILQIPYIEKIFTQEEFESHIK
ncbi:MAG: hypothetical protein AB7R69_00885 [Candidatus Babeliales bacterium]